MDFHDALHYMQGRLRFGEKLGNERFLALLERLGNPQERLRVIHVAGTKGKGSTTAMAASMLRAAGYRAGVYLSPFVYDVRERIQINGVPISPDDFARLVTLIKPHIEAIEATILGATTEFELKTAIGLCYFCEERVDYAVLEVGIGGRLDATNVVSHPLVTIITNIGLDHTEILGDTLGKIAGEKAGIIKPGAPCVTGVPIGGEADQVIERICAERGAALSHVTAVNSDGVHTSYQADADHRLTITTPYRTVSGLRLRLAGSFQHANAAVAVAALDAISVNELSRLPDDAVRIGLEQTYLPGRFQRIGDRPAIIVDVAHNEIAAEALAEALSETFGSLENRLVLVVGMSRRHSPEPFLRPLAALNPAALIATEPSFRALPAEDVALAAKELCLGRVQVVKDGVADAVRAALAIMPEDGVLCLTGSFYTVGDVPPAIWARLIAERNSN